MTLSKIAKNCLSCVSTKNGPHRHTYLSQHRSCRFALGLVIFMTCALFIFLCIPVPEGEYKIRTTKIENCEPSPQKYPPVIHQIWLNYTAFPDKWDEPISSCLNLNKNYTYRRWSAAEIDAFLEREYPWILPTYKSYRYHVQRVDAARLFILYHYGGVYIDMDLYCVMPFSDITKKLKDYDVILSRGATFGVSNHIMLAKPRHPYMELAIRSLPEYNVWRFIPYITIMYSAGPLFLTMMLDIFACKDQIYVFPPEPEHNKYYLNMHGGTWHTWDTGIIDWLGAVHKGIKRVLTWNSFVVLVVLLSILFIYNIKTRSKRAMKKAKDSSNYLQIDLNEKVQVS